MSTKKFIALIVAVIVLEGGALYSQKHFTESSSRIATSSPEIITEKEVATTTETISRIPKEERKKELTTQVVTKAGTSEQLKSETSSVPVVDSSEYTFKSSVDGSALEAMNSYRASAAFSFSIKEFTGLGAFVEEVNGRKNSDGYYWILLINGKKSDKGVSTARVSVGDSIVWRYEHSF